MKKRRKITEHKRSRAHRNHEMTPEGIAPCWNVPRLEWRADRVVRDRCKPKEKIHA